MRIVNLTEETKKDLLDSLLKRSPNNYDTYTVAVNEIVNNVRTYGDKALHDYTLEFDKVDITSENLVVTEEEIAEACATAEKSGIMQIIRKSAENIRIYHEKQRQYSWFDSKPDGSILGQKITALSKVGVYVPGGKAAYPSSVLMNIIPAKVAGVEQIIMTTPPGKDGKVNSGTLAAAHIAGCDKI